MSPFPVMEPSHASGGSFNCKNMETREKFVDPGRGGEGDYFSGTRSSNEEKNKRLFFPGKKGTRLREPKIGLQAKEWNRSFMGGGRTHLEKGTSDDQEEHAGVLRKKPATTRKTLFGKRI